MIAKKKYIVRKIKNFTINFGPQHPAAHGVLRRAGKTHCAVFLPRRIGWYYFFSSFFVNLLLVCLTMLGYETYHQFNFKLMMSGETKRLSLVVKISANHS